jgi:hypothetical protein
MHLYKTSALLHIVTIHAFRVSVKIGSLKILNINLQRD